MPTTSTNSFVVRILAWVNERFPLANLLLFAVLYGAALLYGRFLTTGGALPLGVADLPGFVAVTAFFLMLRVFDEHKDFERDARFHPERVLQRGLITLGHLKVVGVFAVLVQLGVSLWIDEGLGRVSACWLVVMGWSLLMAREFFIGRWLEKRMVLYAISHMVVLPMAMVWMMQMGAGEALLPPAAGWLPALAFLSGFAFEITRKTWAPASEKEGLDSYSKVIGVRAAPLLVVGLVVAQAAVLAAWLFSVHDTFPNLIFMLSMLATALLPGQSLWRFARHPTPRGSKQNETWVAVATLATYAIVIAALLSLRGVAA